MLDEVYAPIVERGTPQVVTDYATAEMVKTAANSFLATKISFINAMAELCEATGADVKQLADAIGYDDRIGRKFLNAGLGFGGGCLPKDIRAFMARAGELGADQALTFLREVDNINMRRRIRMVDLAREVCDGSLVGKRVAVLGAAFKPDSDDIRDSPALNVAAQLQLQGAVVRVTDPAAVENSPTALAAAGLRRHAGGGRRARRRRPGAHRVEAVPRARPGELRQGGQAEAGARRTQRPRPRRVDRRRVDATARWAAAPATERGQANGRSGHVPTGRSSSQESMRTRRPDRSSSSSLMSASTMICASSGVRTFGSQLEDVFAFV